MNRININGIHELDISLPGDTTTSTAQGVTTITNDHATCTFYLNTGAPANPAAWALADKNSNIISVLKVYVITSDIATALTFDVLRNGVSVLTAPIVMAAHTLINTVTTFTPFVSNPLPVTKDDKFVLVISTGTTAWTGTIQLE